MAALYLIVLIRLPLQVLAPLLALPSLADADTSGLYHDRPERPTLVPALRQKDVNGGSFPPDFTSPHAMLPAPAAKDLDDRRSVATLRIGDLTCSRYGLGLCLPDRAVRGGC